MADLIAEMKRLAPATIVNKLARQVEQGGLPAAGSLRPAQQAGVSWDMTLKLQGDTFGAVKEVGGLDVQLVYFRGLNECRASPGDR